MKTLEELGISIKEIALSHKNINQSPCATILSRASDDGERIVIGYIAHDDSCEDPLNSDAEGRIVTASRRTSIESHRAFQVARGLDPYWEPNLSLIDDDTGKSEEELLAMWKEAILSGKIGNPLAITLDVYEHSGTLFSISGEGPQDRFDTARGGALWIPDDSAVENIKLIALQKAREAAGINSAHIVSGWSKEEGHFSSATLPDGQIAKGKGFDSLYAAELAATNRVLVAMGKPEIIELDLQAQQKIAREYAKGVLDVYNKWLAGDTWGLVVETFERATTKSGASTFLSVKEEASWGFIGEENVVTELNAYFESEIESIDNLAATPALS